MQPQRALSNIPSQGRASRSSSGSCVDLEDDATSMQGYLQVVKDGAIQPKLIEQSANGRNLIVP